MSHPGAGARRRVPPPVFRRRLASGAGAIEQPNAASDGPLTSTPRFWAAVVITGIASGLLGVAMMALLSTVARWAFGHDPDGFTAGVVNASGVRRVLSPLLAGVIGGIGWYLLRRGRRGGRPPATTRAGTDIEDALWRGTGQLSFPRSVGTGTLSEVVVGMGASLGREAAPKLLGGAFGSALAGWSGLSAPQRRLLVSCGAGAGFAAVYNVPLGGALFAAEVLCGSITLATILPALACAAVATLTAYSYLPMQATYVHIPNYRTSAALMVWALLIGPLVGLLATGYIRVIGWVAHHRAKGLLLLVALPIALTVLGLIGLAYPQLFGNGRAMARDVFQGHGAFLLLLALCLLKPFLTALCLGAGAAGGLFTPVFSTGAVLGGALGIAWSHLWPGTPVGAYAMVAAAAMIGAAMQAPLAALVLVLELTHSGFQLAVPLVAATMLATTVTRYLDGYSIYSARLPRQTATQSPP